MRSLLISFAFFTSVPLAALAQVYDCKPTTFGTGGFVSDRIILALDVQANAGSAVDYFINETHQAPIPVDLKRLGEGTYEFSWKLRNVKTSNAGSAVLSQKVTLDQRNLTFRMRGRQHGSDNNIHASGTCKIVK